MIDSHAHVASPDSLRFPHSTEFPRAPKFDAPVEALLQDMNVVGVERAVLIQPSLYGFDHSYLLACLREHPSRFVGVALADPLDTHFAWRLASAWLKTRQSGASGLHPLLIPPVHGSVQRRRQWSTS
jgi:predicted TIM-barrel fold metal-dependent hydrolase